MKIALPVSLRLNERILEGLYYNSDVAVLKARSQERKAEKIGRSQREKPVLGAGARRTPAWSILNGDFCYLPGQARSTCMEEGLQLALGQAGASASFCCSAAGTACNHLIAQAGVYAML